VHVGRRRRGKQAFDTNHPGMHWQGLRLEYLDLYLYDNIHTVHTYILYIYIYIVGKIQLELTPGEGSTL